MKLKLVFNLKVLTKKDGEEIVKALTKVGYLVNKIKLDYMADYERYDGFVVVEEKNGR